MSYDDEAEIIPPDVLERAIEQDESLPPGSTVFVVGDKIYVDPAGDEE